MNTQRIKILQVLLTLSLVPSSTPIATKTKTPGVPSGIIILRLIDFSR